MILETLESLGLTQAELARRVGMNQVTLWRKLNGQRPLTQEEIDRILTELRGVDPKITYERAFGHRTPSPEAATA